jgi:sugar phosphate isomerase/epimerase
MTMTRRKFILTTSAATVSALILPKILKASPVRKQIGLQLYTVRGPLEKDLKGTLKKIAGIGYSYLEAAGYSDGKFYGLAPAELRKMVDDLGMQMISSHAMFTEENAAQAIEAHRQLGVKYIVFPSFPITEHKTKDDFNRACDALNRAGTLCNKSGIRFGYHNHSLEFEELDGIPGYDIMLKNTDPSLVCFQVDLYWMTYAGYNPIDYFENFPGRFELWHVKDMDKSPEKGMTEVGTGLIPYADIFRKKKLAGLRYFFVEQDECKIDPVESAAISYDNIKKMKF